MDAGSFDATIPACVKAILKSHISNCLLKYDPSIDHWNLLNGIYNANTAVMEEYRVYQRVKTPYSSSNKSSAEKVLVVRSPDSSPSGKALDTSYGHAFRGYLHFEAFKM